MAFERDPDEIGALWVRTSAAGKDYMTGEINGQKVVIFRAKPSEKGPAWRVMKSKPREEASPREQRYRHADKPMTAMETDAHRAREGRPVFDRHDDEDLGF